MFTKFCTQGLPRKLSSKLQFRDKRLTASHGLHRNLHDLLQMCVTFLHMFWSKTSQRYFRPRAISFSDFRRTEGKTVIAYVKETLSIFWKYLVGFRDKLRYGRDLKNVLTEFSEIQPNDSRILARCASELAACCLPCQIELGSLSVTDCQHREGSRSNK
jgi:hypothetical protein